MSDPNKKYITFKSSDLPKLSPEEFARIDKALRESSSNPIAQALAKQKTNEYYLNEWIYNKNEMLNGKSPVEAMKSKKGRGELQELFKYMEAQSAIMPDLFYK